MNRRLFLGNALACITASYSPAYGKDKAGGEIIPCGSHVLAKDGTRLKSLERAYGGNVIGKPLVASLQSNLWKRKVLNAYFLNGSKADHDLVERTAATWSNHANIRFNFHGKKKPKSPHLCINFGKDGNWSYIGKQCEDIAKKGEPSMSLEDVSESVILHEFGHALGLHHEHQSPNARINWNEQAVIQYYKEEYGWDKSKTEANVLKPVDAAGLASEFDPYSIMLYAFPPEFTNNGFGTSYNRHLSKTDQSYIARLYPKSPCAKCGGQGYKLIRVGGGNSLSGFGKRLGRTEIAVCVKCNGTGND